MNKSLILLFSIALAVISCTEKKKNISITDFKLPVVLDTFKINRVDRINTWLVTGTYNPTYIGPRRDTIIFALRPDLRKYYVYAEQKRNYKFPEKSEIAIAIDTTRIVSDFSWFTEDDSATESKWVNAYPVFVINITQDTLDIGYGTHVPIIMEARDPKGKWRPIEERFIYMCGTGLNTIILPPNQLVVTSAPVNKGKFKTRLRLRYQGVLSSEFSGSINLSQFESEWDKNGERKPLPKEGKSPFP